MAKTRDKAEAKVLESSPTHLLHRVLQIALDYHADAAGPSGLTQRQYAVLAAAADRAGLTQSELVRATGIDRSTLAELVARMEAKGLILREKSQSDARANTVSLTVAGRAALDGGVDPASAADERLLSALPAKKRAGFVKLLAILAGAADGAEVALPTKKLKKAGAKKAKRKKSKKDAKSAPDAAPSA